MATITIGKVYMTHALENTTGRWLLVGNATEVIGHYSDQTSAIEAMRARFGTPASGGIDESRWAQVEVVAPGESVACRLVQYLRGDDGGPSDEEVGTALFAEMFGG